MSNGEYGERISKLEVKTDNLEKKIDDLVDVKVVVTELALLSKQQIEQNKDFKETQMTLVNSYGELKTTLSTMNENLSGMNEEMKENNARLAELEDKVECIDDRSKVDILKIIIGVVPWLLLAGTSFWVLKLTGLVSF
ncbi:MAG: hypothetical protein GX339_05215 [Tissierellia bacterium]|nr:hypothetical protein [Tissierellia bacterium]